MVRKKKILLIFVFVFLCFFSASAFAIESLGVMWGYLNADLKDKSDYEAVPLMVSFGFNAKKAAAKIGIYTKGILEFQIEPFLNPVIRPDANAEMGVDFLIKYAFPLNKKFFPYAKFGVGPVFMTQHTREQSTQFNFVDTAAAGFSWFIRKDLSLDLEYRYRHLSNAGIKHPNHGIGANIVLVGFSRYF